MSSGKINGTVHISNTDIGDEIKDAIHAGIKDGLTSTAVGMEEAARGQIIAKDAIWKTELLDGFGVDTNGRTYVELTNSAEHAPYQEHGVSGTEVKRDSPYSYTTRGPPVESLLPWFLDKIWT
jgi:hypothetical protein